MFYTPFTFLVLALSLFNITIANAVADGEVALEARQSPDANADAGPGAVATPEAATDPLCREYSMVANLSTVGLTPDYRAAWLRSSPLGTDAASAILDTQSPKLPEMMVDAELNTRCGNLSIIATEQAEANFTAGTVLGLPIQEAFGADPGGFATPFCSFLIIVVMGGTFLSL